MYNSYLVLSFQVVVRSHFYLQNHFGVVRQDPMLELSKGKHSQILMDIELNMSALK